MRRLKDYRVLDDITAEVSERRDDHALMADITVAQAQPHDFLGFLDYLGGSLPTELLADDTASEIEWAVYEAAYNAGWETLERELLRYLPALDAIRAAQ